MLQIKFKLNKNYYYVGIAHLSGTHSNKIIKKTFTIYRLNYLGTRFSISLLIIILFVLWPFNYKC